MASLTVAADALHRRAAAPNCHLGREATSSQQLPDDRKARALLSLARGVKDDVDLTKYVVTRWYRAPELLCSCVDYTEAIDVWRSFFFFFFFSYLCLWVLWGG